VDSYTVETQQWLNNRFRRTTEEGVYYAHQNIYGFRNRRNYSFCEDGVIKRYVIFCNIIRELKSLEFSSLLDVGGAEGYMAAAIREFFQVKVRSCDLSGEACNRAREIFKLDADVVDAMELPYKDEAFDVVLSSECLEHIPQYERVLGELLRVAKKAVIVTVPHDGPEAIEANIRNKVPHGHIHDFTLDSLARLVGPGCRIRSLGLYSTILRLPFRLMEGRLIDPEARGGVKRMLVAGLNRVLPWFGSLMNERAFKLLLKIDPFLSSLWGSYRGVVFVITKNALPTATSNLTSKEVDAILKFQVPPQVLN
jgi:ubiquinone/menaquinone biosynthesis C-methylase UbiE